MDRKAFIEHCASDLQNAIGEARADSATSPISLPAVPSAYLFEFLS
jgi:hypothetical protein